MLGRTYALDDIKSWGSGVTSLAGLEVRGDWGTQCYQINMTWPIKDQRAQSRVLNRVNQEISLPERTIGRNLGPASQGWITAWLGHGFPECIR